MSSQRFGYIGFGVRRQPLQSPATVNEYESKVIDSVIAILKNIAIRRSIEISVYYECICTVVNFLNYCRILSDGIFIQSLVYREYRVGGAQSTVTDFISA